MDDRIPLTAEDRAILDLESDTVAGHTLKVIRIAEPGVTAGQLREAVAGRIDSAPELTRKLGGKPGKPCWVSDADFDLDRHIAVHANGEEISGDEIRRATAALLGERLDRALPLWRIDVAPMSDGGTALIWRIHHVMADGSTAMRLARQVLWDGHEAGGGESRGPRREAASVRDHERRRRHLLGLYEREFARSSSASPFDGDPGAARTVSFATVSLSELHDSAKSLTGATLNDAVLAVIAGALRHWMDIHDGIRADSLRVKVPVSLHHGDDGLANRDSYFSVPLPLGEPDPLRRLRAITEATSERKIDHDAEELDRVLRSVSGRSKRLGHLLGKVEASPRRFAFTVSNVKGPRNPVTIGGAPVETIHSVVEIGRHHALRIAVLSVDDRLCFGFCADPELVADLEEMAAGAEKEAGLLGSLARGGP
jgi:hypothetical protein